MGWRGFELIAAAWGCSAALIILMLPMFRRYALARPNARSSHKIPTPQGGGLAVILAMMIALGANILLVGPELTVPSDMLPLGAAVVLLAVVGAIDDIFPLSPSLRLGVQAVAVALTVLTMPEELRALPVVPVSMERAVEILAGLWFVNLVNFMDGIDWMTVAETVPSTACLFAFALFGATPTPAGPVALALCGAVLGFAPFNRPAKAKLFLGDVGSLPIGLLLFWLLLQLAGSGHLAAALLLPLYYVADATITLLRRFARGERLTEAHRSHFYQLAVIRGLPVMTVVEWVCAVNVALAILAALSIWLSSAWFDITALAGGGALVAALLVMMERGKR
jgi:UDP-N-acetylmuramyl pentapeptide phosphotransferase/UDP-N-acetylglucosamine-1-phosphate transferase